MLNPTYSKRPEAAPNKQLQESAVSYLLLGLDLKAARAAHCPIFLLPYGYNEGRDVNTLDADAIIPTVLDALPLIQRACVA